MNFMFHISDEYTHTDTHFSGRMLKWLVLGVDVFDYAYRAVHVDRVYKCRAHTCMMSRVLLSSMFLV